MQASSFTVDGIAVHLIFVVLDAEFFIPEDNIVIIIYYALSAGNEVVVVWWYVINDEYKCFG